jgi:hypothetical protein
MHPGAVPGAVYMFAFDTQKWTTGTRTPNDVYNANAVALGDKDTILYCGGYMTNNCYASSRPLVKISIYSSLLSPS